MDSSEFIDKFYDPEDKKNQGFADVAFNRQKHKDGLAKRLKKYHLTDDELEKLFKIIEKSEVEIEKIKRKFSFDKDGPLGQVKMRKKIDEIQKKMQDDFENKLMETVKKKYEKAKKDLEKRKKNK